MMKFIHITDPHILPAGRKLCGLDPAARLAAAVEDINRNHSDAQCVVLTGDLSYHGLDAGYEQARETLSALIPPCHLLLGNHDERAAFKRVFTDTPCDEAGFVQYVVETQVGAFIMLDSLCEGTDAGLLCEQRQAWLDRQLKRFAGSPVFLFLHHPPFDIGIASLDGMKLIDGEALAEPLRRHGRVRQIFYGHVHRAVWGSWHGIPTSALPGTNHQVGLDLQADTDMYGTHEPPAYGVCLIDETSVVVHLREYLDQGPRFILSDAILTAATTPDQLVPVDEAIRRRV
jgi:Icc protein